MTSRKTQQEIDKTFKKVAEGIQSFEGIYDKIKSSSNAAQRDKLEDNLKREIKKLQRFRDQIKTWAAGNEVKDKGPLLEQRRAIETCMEQFKAVEKEMKTKAYSKEGLSAAARLDPKEKEKAETCDFLSSTVDILQQKIEAMEAEEEMIQASLKKGKKDAAKTTRLSDITRILERHRWHVTKLELLLRCLQNGNVETSQVLDIKDSIKYFADDGHNADFCGEDETIYDDITLGDDEFGMPTDNDRVSSQDTQSIQDDDAEAARSKAKAEPGPARRPSTQMKSPLPVLATLHNGPSSTASGSMKPAPLPTRLPGETLKYASAAAAAAASDKSGVGIAPLPPPPGTTSSTASPQVHHVQPVQRLASAAPSVDDSASQQQSKSPTLPSAPTSRPATVPPPPATDNVEPVASDEHAAPTTNGEPKEDATPAPAPALARAPAPASNDESVYHLPPGLQDLIQSFEITKSRVSVNPSTSVQRLLTASHHTCPEPGDAEKPRHYKPQTPYNTPLYYPQEVLPIFDDPRLYETGRIDTDTLFYIFYYRQASYQQYLAAKSLKNQSWRFHKQYQTWFQRHEEPKTITEEFEQGTYRFFDYESTWMNRRKADFKFVYKFLEDDL
ncbi:CCR4-NOT transcription complex [Histoplasma capsulatum G186AR]|uniref:General negative regulator of transcription subunit n=2 Tax=Ajellomyces capsulatus TaxID=5037 RepID=C0NZE5_AJECG|nr:CCR4-NOT transcription complex [Histoplasma capsulatum G186AR]EEH03193.1 CCR4-NOT transcription complex [Histoplasma capsulatum G186AR]KAG5290405.1 CCR4-NOT transcription complex [Histoplasma capsulatum]QSS72332.1 CCR4-NOT transcription complex [Histoplasma capsulatum G186AR]